VSIKGAPRPSLDVAGLLRVLPALTGEREDVAIATLLRSACLRDVVVQVQRAWTRADPADRSPDYETRLTARWREWATLLASAPADAAFWIQHAQDGAWGTVRHALLAASTGGEE
jgi:hypothetical protein